jgi:hypothetical protein
VPGQAARAVTRLTSGVVSTVVHQRSWLVVVEVTHLVTRHQLDQPVAVTGFRCSSGRKRNAHATVARSHARKINNGLQTIQVKTQDHGPELGRWSGAGDGNRTRTISLGVSVTVGAHQLIRRSAIVSACP